MSRRQQLIDKILASSTVSGSVLTSLRGDFSSAIIRYLARCSQAIVIVKSRVRVDATLKDALIFLKEHVV